MIFVNELLHADTTSESESLENVEISFKIGSICFKLSVTIPGNTETISFRFRQLSKPERLKRSSAKPP